MLYLKTISNLLITILLVSTLSASHSQTIDVTTGSYISNMPGDELNAQWSADGKSILFQSINNNKIGLCIFQIDIDTLNYIVVSDYDFNNPVWHPDGDKVVFDTKKNGISYLYVIDLTTNSISPLFNRNISCRNATFSASKRQVYFTGYDKPANRWEIYSYDFVYDNLNKLTNNKLGCSNPIISNDGKLIAYCKANPFKNTKSIEVINWYGKQVISFGDFNGEFPTWNETAFKLFFISYNDNQKGELYSIWKDGSHLQRHTFDDIEIIYPSLSPDESKIALSVLTQNGWDVFIVPFDD